MILKYFFSILLLFNLSSIDAEHFYQNIDEFYYSADLFIIPPGELITKSENHVAFTGLNLYQIPKLNQFFLNLQFPAIKIKSSLLAHHNFSYQNAVVHLYRFFTQDFSLELGIGFSEFKIRDQFSQKNTTWISKLNYQFKLFLLCLNISQHLTSTGLFFNHQSFLLGLSYVDHKLSEDHESNIHFSLIPNPDLSLHYRYDFLQNTNLISMKFQVKKFRWLLGVKNHPFLQNSIFIQTGYQL